MVPNLLLAIHFLTLCIIQHCRVGFAVVPYVLPKPSVVPALPGIPVCHCPNAQRSRLEHPSKIAPLVALFPGRSHIPSSLARGCLHAGCPRTWPACPRQG
jgi:hypothetical protein